MSPKPLEVEMSIGEFVDKLTILKIKTERISDPRKLENIRHEHGLLQAQFEEAIERSPEIDALVSQLEEVNKALWDIEDAIREKERRQTFDEEFIQIARSVYFENDRRADIKRQINSLTGSVIVEEKSYSEY